MDLQRVRQPVQNCPRCSRCTADAHTHTSHLLVRYSNRIRTATGVHATATASTRTGSDPNLTHARTGIGSAASIMRSPVSSRNSEVGLGACRRAID